MGEATNPGPLKRLPRSFASASQSNRFCLQRTRWRSPPQFRRLQELFARSRRHESHRHPDALVVWFSFLRADPIPRMVPPAVEAMPAPTVGDTDTDIPHHVIGTPRDSDTDETMSVSQISGDGVLGVGEIDEFSVHNDEAVSVAGEGPEPEVEAVPIPVADVNPTRVLRKALRSLDGVDVMPLI